MYKLGTVIVQDVLTIDARYVAGNWFKLYINSLDTYVVYTNIDDAKAAIGRIFAYLQDETVDNFHNLDEVFKDE